MTLYKIGIEVTESLLYNRDLVIGIQSLEIQSPYPIPSLCPQAPLIIIVP
jgi:hypothetical protein